MLCLFLLFQKFIRVTLNSYPACRRLSEFSLCLISVRLLCGFAQISLILVCILLKLDFLDRVHVAYVVFGVALVGGK